MRSACALAALFGTAALGACAVTTAPYPYPAPPPPAVVYRPPPPPPPVAVYRPPPGGRWYYNGRYWYHRRWNGARWIYY